MNKQELINKITAYPIEYAMIMGLYKDGAWDIKKLEFSELQRLVDIERDLVIFERNKKRLKDGN